MKVALVHDYLMQIGGAERVLEEFVAMFPDAPIFTLLYDEKGTHGRFEGREIVTSFLQRIPYARRNHRLFPVLMPLAVEHLIIEGFDLVISSSWGFAKGVIVPPETRHISFCHTPLRYAWDDSHRYIDEFQSFPRLLKFAAPLALTYIRLWDHAAAQRPDLMLANSRYVRQRIRKYYARDAQVIYPPVRTEFFAVRERRPKDSYLMVGRLMAYKRFDLGIKAAAKAGVKLRIVGDGPEYKNLQKLAGSLVTFLGAVDDEALREELATCSALLFPQEEDFGIVAAEALAAGTPVIAYGAGGATEIITDGETGVFVSEQSVDAFTEALRSFSHEDYDAKNLRARAAEFDRRLFHQRMHEVIRSVVTDGKERDDYGESTFSFRRFDRSLAS